MWIASKYGFFSIVKKADGFHVRARVRHDLENLCAALKWHDDNIKCATDADYRYRIITDELGLTFIFGTLENSIDYDNFKTEIASGEQADKLPVYHRIWTEMHGYRTRKEDAGIFAARVREMDAENEKDNPTCDFCGAFLPLDKTEIQIEKFPDKPDFV
jgi:hypothetical protein